MSDLTGLKLRAAACGPAWGLTRFQSYGNGGGFYHRNGCMETSRRSSCQCSGHWNLPAIESDPAVSEPMFLEWCEHEGYWFSLDCAVANFFRVILVPKDGGAAVIASGSTPSEARARGIVAAHGRAHASSPANPVTPVGGNSK